MSKTYDVVQFKKDIKKMLMDEQDAIIMWHSFNQVYKRQFLSAAQELEVDKFVTDEAKHQNFLSKLLDYLEEKSK